MMQKTNFPFEVLIHDDASTDHTADIIREYEAKYPDVIKPIYQTENQHSKNVRISIVYNYSRAQGKYIALCEGDDFWCNPKKLQTQYDFMESHPDYSLCASNFALLDEFNRTLTYSHPNRDLAKTLDREKRVSEILINGAIYRTASLLFRKDKYELCVPEIIRDSNIAKCGDFPLQLHLARHGKIKYFEDAFIVYRVHQNSASNYNNRKQAWRNYFSVGKKRRRVAILNGYDTLCGDIASRHNRLILNLLISSGFFCRAKRFADKHKFGCSYIGMSFKWCVFGLKTSILKWRRLVIGRRQYNALKKNPKSLNMI